MEKLLVSLPKQLDGFSDCCGFLEICVHLRPSVVQIFFSSMGDSHSHPVDGNCRSNRETRDSNGGSAAHDEADEETDAERADNALGGILADVVFGGDVEFLGLHASVLPLFAGGFLEVLGLF